MSKPKGIKQGPQKGSWNEWLSEFEMGERRYVETSLDRYAHNMRVINGPLSRRSEYIRSWRFTTMLFTAVGSNAGDIRYLLCVERIA